jgi:hypothetical protein
MNRADFGGRHNAAHARKLDVDDNSVGTLRADQADAVQCMQRWQYFMTLLAEKRGESVQDHCIVIDDANAHASVLRAGR